MRNPERRHKIFQAHSLDNVVAALLTNVYPMCQGLRWRSLVLLNDSSHKEEQVWAVLRKEGDGVGCMRQVEELTIPLMTPQHVREELTQLDLEGAPNEFGKLGTWGGHPPGPCALCPMPHDFGKAG